MMRAMIWKELRGTALWALAGMLVIGAGYAVALAYTRPDEYSTYLNREATFLANVVQMVTIIGAPLVALVLGLVQTLPESRADRWAMLVHRPVRRSTIFAAKVIAGLSLYFVAMVVPFLIAAWWSSRPGSLGTPFVPAMMLPGLADILAGLVYYFAAMVLAMRHARWLGSRTLPVIAATLVSAAVVMSPEFAWALLWVGTGGGVMAVSAWGAFVAGGEAVALPRLARPALGASLVPGVMIVGTAAIGFMAAIIIDPGRATPIPQYELLPDGRFIRVTQDPFDGNVTEVTDPQGNRLPEVKQELRELGPHVWRRDLARSNWLTLQPGWPFGYPAGYRSERWHFVAVRDMGRYWVWFVRAKRLVEVYDPRTRRLITLIGRDGAGADEASVTPFASDIIDWPGSGLLVLANGLYRLHADPFRVERRWSPPAGVSLVSTAAIGLWGPENGGEHRGLLIAVTDDHQLYVLEHARTLAFLPIPYDVQRWSQAKVYLLEDADQLVIHQQDWRAGDDPQPVAFFRLADGQRVDEIKLPPIRYDLEWDTRMFEYVIMPFAPAGPIAFADMLDRIDAWRQARAGHTFDDLDWMDGLMVTLLLAGAALWAALGWFIPHRYARPRRVVITWAILAGLLGPGALLAMWAMRDWPSSLPCASCGRRRVVDRETCEHCDAAWPRPTRDGTEIFDEPLIQPVI